VVILQAALRLSTLTSWLALVFGTKLDDFFSLSLSLLGYPFALLTMAVLSRIGSYLQKVTSALSMGAECMYQYGPGGEQAVPSFAGR
jgi:pilus assembly protein TadC